MNLAFITPEYPHTKTNHSAGIGSSIKNLATELVKQGHRVTIFVYSQDKNEVLNANGILIHKIAYKRYIIFGWYLYRKHLQKYINSTIKKEGIQIIEAPDWTGITAFMKFDCPLVLRLHGTDAYFCHLEGRKQKTKNYIFEKIALKSADAIVSVSEFTAKKTAELFDIKKTIMVIYNGIDTELFSPSKTAISPNSILYFGSIIRKKGVLELSEIFNCVIEEIPEAKLTLLGKDVVDIKTKKSTLELFMSALSSAAKQNITHIPHIPYNEVKGHIARANVIVLPSFAEAFPMTWLEAMAMEKALVSSNIGWAKELMIDGKTGYSENPKNHEGYAAKIILLLKNKESNITFGKNAKQYIKNNFSQEIIGKQNIDLYLSIMKQ